MFCCKDDEAAFGFETGKQRQEGAKILSLRVCVLTPPSDRNVDSSEPLGSTTWTDPQLRVEMVVFRQSESLFLLGFSYQNRKENDIFFPSIIFLHLEFSFPAQTAYFEGFQDFSNCVFHLILSEQSEVLVQRAKVGLCLKENITFFLEFSIPSNIHPKSPCETSKNTEELVVWV